MPKFIEKCYVFTADEKRARSCACACVCVCVWVEGEVSPFYAVRPNNP